MWLDVIPYAPSLRLADQWFQEAGSVRSGGQSFSSFGTCWTCTCGHTDEKSDDAHALGCNQLSSPVKSCHERAAAVLREFVGLGVGLSQEGRQSPLAPSIPDHPQVLLELSMQPTPWKWPRSRRYLVHPSRLLGAFVSPLGPLAMPLLFGMPTSVLAIFCAARCDKQLLRTRLRAHPSPPPLQPDSSVHSSWPVLGLAKERSAASGNCGCRAV
jgi:hypothetical protein